MWVERSLLVGATLTSAIVAGLMILVLVAFVPALFRLPDAEGLRFHQVLHPLADRYMPVVGTMPVVFGAAVLFYERRLAGWELLTLAGVMCSGATIAVSVAFNVPINRQVDRLGPAGVPPLYPSARRRWSWFHALRTLTGAAAV